MYNFNRELGISNHNIQKQMLRWIHFTILFYSVFNCFNKYFYLFYHFIKFPFSRYNYKRIHVRTFYMNIILKTFHSVGHFHEKIWNMPIFVFQQKILIHSSLREYVPFSNEMRGQMSWRIFKYLMGVNKGSFLMLKALLKWRDGCYAKEENESRIFLCPKVYSQKT